MLYFSDEQILFIAYSVGCITIPHFDRTFKQLVVIAPKEFRETGSKLVSVPAVETENNPEENRPVLDKNSMNYC